MSTDRCQHPRPRQALPGRLKWLFFFGPQCEQLLALKFHYALDVSLADGRIGDLCIIQETGEVFEAAGGAKAFLDCMAAAHRLGEQLLGYSIPAASTAVTCAYPGDSRSHYFGGGRPDLIHELNAARIRAAWTSRNLEVAA